MTLEERFEFLTKSIESHDAQIGRLTDDLATLGQRVDGIADKTDRLTDKMDRLTDKVDRLVERVDRLTENVDRMAGSVDRLAIQQGRTDMQVSDLAGLSRNIAKLVLSYESRMSALESGRAYRDSKFINAGAVACSTWPRSFSAPA